VTSEQPTQPSVADPDVLDEDEAAELLGVSSFTLSEQRKRGYGPPHRRIGKVIRYSRTAVLAWLAGGA
jgi:predicted DNA-binding transcriptional regulator AlpA